MNRRKFTQARRFWPAILALPLLTAACSEENPTTETAPVIQHAGMAADTLMALNDHVSIRPQVQGEGALNYTWTLDGIDAGDQADFQFTASSTGLHTLVYTVENEAGKASQTYQIRVRKYAGGFYMVNEGQYGQSGSIGYYRNGTWSHRIYQANNNGATLGGTACSAVTDRDYMYIVAKEAPCLVKVDLYDFTRTASIDSREILNNGQAQSFCIANEQSGLLGSTRGLYQVDLQTLAVTALNEENTMDMLRYGEYIFVIAQREVEGTYQKAIDVRKASDLSVVRTGIAQASSGFAVSQDGMIWATSGKELIRINPESLECTATELPGEYEVFVNAYAYTPTSMSALPDENALLFVQNEGFANKHIYKYDIATQQVSDFVTAPDNFTCYGAGLAVNSQTGLVYGIYNAGYSDNNRIECYDGQGSPVESIDYSGEYWFPSSICFD